MNAIRNHFRLAFWLCTCYQLSCPPNYSRTLTAHERGLHFRRYSIAKLPLSCPRLNLVPDNCSGCAMAVRHFVLGRNQTYGSCVRCHERNLHVEGFRSELGEAERSHSDSLSVELWCFLRRRQHSGGRRRRRRFRRIVRVHQLDRKSVV